VFGVGVDDQLVDLLLPDFTQHLAVRGRVGLPDVHLGALRGRTLDQVLQLEQTCKHHALLRTLNQQKLFKGIRTTSLHFVYAFV